MAGGDFEAYVATGMALEKIIINTFKKIDEKKKYREMRDAATSPPPYAKEQDKRYQLLVEESLTPACVTSWPLVDGGKKDLKNLEFLWVNQTFAKMLGFEDHEQLRGKKCVDFITQEEDVDQHQLTLPAAALFFARRGLAHRETGELDGIFKQFSQLVSIEELPEREVTPIPAKEGEMTELVEVAMSAAAEKPIVDLVNRWKTRDGGIIYIAWTTVAKKQEGKELFFSHAKNITDLVNHTTSFFERAVALTGAEVKKAAIETLVKTSLPQPVMDLISAGNTNALCTYNASVLFADIVSFTQQTSGKKAEEVGADLSAFHTAVNHLIETEFHQQVHLVKTMGDGLMVTCGAPYREHDHATIMIDFAKRLQDIAKECLLIGSPISLRIGIHSGPIFGGLPIASVARWDVFGEGVNRASRSESNGRPNEICITLDAWNALSDYLAEEDSAMRLFDQINIVELEQLHQLIPVDFLLPEKIPEELKKIPLRTILEMSSNDIFGKYATHFDFMQQLHMLKPIIETAVKIEHGNQKIYPIKAIYPCTMKGLGETILVVVGDRLKKYIPKAAGAPEKDARRGSTVAEVVNPGSAVLAM